MPVFDEPESKFNTMYDKMRQQNLDDVILSYICICNIMKYVAFGPNIGILMHNVHEHRLPQQGHKFYMVDQPSLWRRLTTFLE